MKIILTHEQADFDAIAALLAASLIEESALPVLPRKMNRNVHSFLSLYGEEFHFIEANDLPAEDIEHIMLVDTQALVTLKGTNKKTRVSVIDHHQAKENIDPTWTLRLEKLGSVTTILAEIIQEQNIQLNPHQATLLLLGIYEDTGSLSYSSTTSRDIRAAAYLIEQDASLKIAVNYLNPPLSAEQKAVYDQLLTKVQTVVIHGLRVVISTVEAAELIEEISSIAHKMRDLLDPDGLVIIVATEEGYRMVLRSTTDLINVASLAAYFGGGGHDRASAALVRRPSGQGTRNDHTELMKLAAEVQRILPSMIHTPLTVKQIMSRKPRLIPPTISADEALDLMKKYGYEGFPVVDKGKVMGLLTRRAVDRSLAHKLNLPASSLMDAGEITVSPRDSIDHLQTIMTEFGWGQVPVFDAEKNEIVGIVTRTDLIKTLSTHTPRLQKQNLASRLESLLPRERLLLLQAVADKAANLHMAAYVVGGFVRDLILNRPGSDFDIVVEGDAIALAKALSANYGGRLVCHSRFGTAKWYLDRNSQTLLDLIPPLKETPINHHDFPASLDLITARTEFYEHPTALPKVERSSIKLDLHRRDFTINTMAVRLDGKHYGELLDHWGGYNDLKKGIIRVLHSLSFIDDPTRALRAVRFEQRFDFEIEKRTLDLLVEAADQLRTISGERIRHELDLILVEEKGGEMLKRLDDLSILTNIHPALSWNPSLTQTMMKLINQPVPSDWDLPDRLWNYPLTRILGYTFWLMDLPNSELRSVCQRIRIPGNIERVIRQARLLKEKIHSLVNQRPSEITAFMDDINPASMLCVYSRLTDDADKALIERYQAKWRFIHSSINGNDLIKLGIPTGPHIKDMLIQLKGAWLDGKITNSDEEQQFIARLTKLYSF